MSVLDCFDKLLRILKSFSLCCLGVLDILLLQKLFWFNVVSVGVAFYTIFYWNYSRLNANLSLIFFPFHLLNNKFIETLWKLLLLTPLLSVIWIQPFLWILNYISCLNLLLRFIYFMKTFHSVRHKIFLLHAKCIQSHWQSVICTWLRRTNT